MENNITVIAKMGATLSSSSLATNMIIFNDAIFVWLSIIGAMASSLGVLHDIYQTKSISGANQIITELLKAFFLGGILTPMFFMAYMHIGGNLVESFIGIKGMGSIYNSFWFLLAILTSWYSVLIWGAIINKKIAKAKDGK